MTPLLQRWACLAALTLAGLTAPWDAAAAPCARAKTLRDIEATRKAALKAFQEMDDADFSMYVDRTLEIIDCLEEPLAPADAARLHELLVLDAFFLDDLEGARRSLQSAINAIEGYQLPADLVPEGHPLRPMFDEVRAQAEAPGLPLADETFRVTVDGTEADRIPTDRPVLLQRLDVTGAVLETRYVDPGGALPDWAPLQTPAQEAPPPAEPTEAWDEAPTSTGEGGRWWPYVTAGGVSAALAVSGGVFYGLTLNTYNQNDVATDPSMRGYYADELYPRFVTSVVLGVAGGIGIAATGALAWRKQRRAASVAVLPAPGGAAVMTLSWRR